MKVKGRPKRRNGLRRIAGTRRAKGWREDELEGSGFDENGGMTLKMRAYVRLLYKGVSLAKHQKKDCQEKLSQREME